jgi:hypothetical protein
VCFARLLIPSAGRDRQLKKLEAQSKGIIPDEDPQKADFPGEDHGLSFLSDSCEYRYSQSSSL